MSLHWGGRGRGRRSRWTAVATGGIAAQQVILVPLLGQSNIEGRNALDGLDLDITDVYQFGGDDSDVATYQLISADITPLRHPQKIGGRVGPGINLLAKVKAQNPDAMVVGIPCSVGSIAMVAGGWTSSPTPGGGGLQFEFAVNQTIAARTAALAMWPGATITPLCALVQGEQDAAGAVAGATYYTALTNFIADFRSRVTGFATAPFVIGSMLPQKFVIGSPNYLADYAAIDEQHVKASLNISGVKYSRGPDNRAANDNLHYQPHAVARQQGDWLGDTLVDAVGPTITSANTYSNLAGSALSFALTASDTYSHATFHLDGGADVAQFEISDPYISPTLRWVGNGTGPAAGTYVVGIRARDGAGNYGATQTFTLTASAEVSPVTFFTSGERGMVWDLTDSSTLFQDVAGTTPVTTAGQTVGRILDKSGNGNHWTAAADNTTRPTYQVDADSKPYLSFDGSNDAMFAATPFVIPGSDIRHSVCVGLFGNTQASERDVIGCYSTSSGTPFVEPLAFKTSAASTYSMRNDSSGGFSPAAGTVAGILDNTTKKVVSAHFNGTGSTMRQRDAAQRPAGGGTGYSSPGGWSNTIGTIGSNFAVTRAALGCRGFGTPNGFFTGRIYSGYVINRFVTDAEVKAGEEWVAARTITGTLP